MLPHLYRTLSFCALLGSAGWALSAERTVSIVVSAPGANVPEVWPVAEGASRSWQPADGRITLRVAHAGTDMLISYRNGNSPPRAMDANHTTSPVSLSATDPDGDDLIYQLGSATSAEGAQLALDGILVTVSNTPTSGSDSFTFSAYDPFGATSSSATITLEATGGSDLDFTDPHPVDSDPLALARSQSTVPLPTVSDGVPVGADTGIEPLKWDLDSNDDGVLSPKELDLVQITGDSILQWNSRTKNRQVFATSTDPLNERISEGGTGRSDATNAMPPSVVATGMVSGLPLVQLSGGSFIMGGETETMTAGFVPPLAVGPTRLVELSPYAVAKYPLTNQQVAELWNRIFGPDKATIDAALEAHYGDSAKVTMLTQPWNAGVILMSFKWDGINAFNQQRLAFYADRGLSGETQVDLYYVEDGPVGIRDVAGHPDGDVDSRRHHPAGNTSWAGFMFLCWAMNELDPELEQAIILPDLVYPGANSPNTTFRMDPSKQGWRLPTEAEWECAARGGLIGKAYPWGNQHPAGRANLWGDGDPYENTGEVQTTPVYRYPPNGYGLYDMGGNTNEMAYDIADLDAYEQTTQAVTDPIDLLRDDDPLRLNRIIRGGSYLSSAHSSNPDNYKRRASIAAGQVFWRVGGTADDAWVASQGTRLVISGSPLISTSN